MIQHMIFFAPDMMEVCEDWNKKAMRHMRMCKVESESEVPWHQEEFPWTYAEMKDMELNTVFQEFMNEEDFRGHARGGTRPHLTTRLVYEEVKMTREQFDTFFNNLYDERTQRLKTNPKDANHVNETTLQQMRWFIRKYAQENLESTIRDLSLIHI